MAGYKMKISISHIIIGILLLASGCIQPPTYPKEPEITGVTISRNMITQLDSIRIKIEFTDGDGDIGYNNLDTSDCNLCDSSCLKHPTLNLFLFDSRTGCMTPYNVPFIPEKGSSEAITGEISVVSPAIFCIPTSGIVGEFPPFDTLTYYIQLKDRAGNLSNVMETPEIFVDC